MMLMMVLFCVCFGLLLVDDFACVAIVIALVTNDLAVD